MPKIIATLKQHTPIMHFQHDEVGATLRGTELKSGLDAFLNAYTKTGETVKNEKNEEKPTKPEWHMGTKKALNYRVMVQTEGYHRRRLIFNPKINCNPESLPAERAKVKENRRKLYNDYYIDITNTPFFALMGKEHDRGSHQEAEKYAACTADKVTVTFMVPDPDLAKIIVQWLPIYFLVNNFGARKSKGFGSFTVIGLTLNGKSQQLRQNIDLLKDFLSAKQPEQDGFESALYAMKYAGPEPENGFVIRNKTQSDIAHPFPLWLTVMENINWLYKLMKSGYNFPSTDPRRKIYHRSYLMKGYAYHKEGITYNNEKRFMKQNLCEIGNLCPGYDDENGRHLPSIQNIRYMNSKNQPAYRYVRAMLGLTDKFEFRQNRQSRTVTVADADTNANANADKNDAIRRFESPLLFKPISEGETWRCYIILRKIPECMYNRTFLFSCGGETRPLATPSEDEFKLVEFMDFCCSNHSDLHDESGKLMFEPLNLKRIELEVGK